jgi:hypothetical protein
MSLQAIYQAFQAAAASGQVDGNQLALLGTLVGQLGQTSLPLTGGRTSLRGSTATLEGQTRWRNTDWSLTITGDEQAGKDHLSLAMRAIVPAGPPWTFGTAFTGLPESRVLSESVGGGLILGRSLIADLPLTQVQATAEATEDTDPPLARLGGWMPLTGTVLEQYVFFIGAGPLWTDGTMDFTHGSGPVLILDCATPSAPLDFPGMSIQKIGVRLRNDLPDEYSLDETVQPLSVIQILFETAINTGSETVVTVTAPLAQGGSVWPLEANIEPPLTLSDGIRGLLSIFPGATISDFKLPEGIAPLDAFGVKELEFGVTPPVGSILPGIEYTAVTIQSTTPWDVPVPFLTLKDVGTRWLFNWGDPVPLITGSVFGTMVFGEEGQGSLGVQPPNVHWRRGGSPGSAILDDDGNTVELFVEVGLPSLDIQAKTLEPISVDLGSAIQAYFPGAAPYLPTTLKVIRVSANASILNQIYGASLVVGTDWEIPIGNVRFTLANIFFSVNVSQATLSGNLNGFFGVNVEGDQKALLTAGAMLRPDGHWNFHAGLADGTLNVPEFAFAFLGTRPPDWLTTIANLELTRLYAEISTDDGFPYEFEAALSVRWDVDVLGGLKLSLAAETEVRRYEAETDSDLITLEALSRRGVDPEATPRAPGHWLNHARLEADTPTMVYSGRVQGSFAINRILVTLGVSYVRQELTYLFRLSFDRFSLEARTSWIGEGADRHQILTVQLSGVTLGGMVESFARLANPNQNYRLEPPWDFLNKIDLGRFTLILDPREQAVTLDYRVNLNLGFAHLKSVGLRYQRSEGQPQIKFELTGSFLGKTYDRTAGKEPLSWDALNDSPPEIPGAGQQLVDLRYLGFGQHVELSGIVRQDSMADIIAKMQDQLRPIADGAVNPLDQPSGSQLGFNEARQWLIGLDITLMETVTAKLVMNDPVLYGVLISLAGPTAGTLSGFSFELIYRKINDDIGMFHARLQVPEIFRRLDFGVIQITLGVISVDIYTNGNFLVDLGFPHDRDFSVSFGLTYGIFRGRGGLYFGLLNGATSERVPRITNGEFNPVLELGVGVAVGLGREVNYGVLAGGAYIEVQVLFQGVLAWFNPDNASDPKAMYYLARGTAAVEGRLYGRVGWKYAGASVDVGVYASVTLTLESHKATLIEVKAGVHVTAKVKVLFIKFNYSFSANIKLDWTVGSDSRTVWKLADSRQSAAYLPADPRHGRRRVARRRPVQLARQLHARRIAARRGDGLAALLAAEAAPAIDVCADYPLTWTPDQPVFPDGLVHDVSLRITPGLTIADVPVDWTGTTPPPNSDPAYRLVMMLSADSATPPEAETIAETHRQTAAHSAQAEDASDMAFSVLIEAMLRYSVSSLGLSPQGGTVSAGDMSELAAGLDCPQTIDQGFSFDALSLLFGKNLLFKLAGPPPTLVSGVAFPMPPVVEWTSDELPDRDFWTYQPVDATYQAGIAAYYAQLDPTDPAYRPAPKLVRQEEDGDSFASFIFRDYMAQIAKAGVEAAQGLMAEFPLPVPANATLAGLAGQFPGFETGYAVHAGDTVETVAEHFGISVQELLALNPNLPAELADAAPGDVLQIHLGVTPESIAADNPTWPLSADKTLAAAYLETQAREGETLTALAERMDTALDAWLQTPALLTQPDMLRTSAELTVDALVYDNPNALPLVQVAAVFYARLPVGGDYPHADWYAESIAALNPGLIDAYGPLPATINVPSAYDSQQQQSWTTLPGDTLQLVARTVALFENLIAGSDFDVYLQAITALNPSYNGGPVTLPAATVPILPDQTLETLAERLLLVSGTPAVPTASFRTLVAGADILQPLAKVPVTDAILTTGSGQTIASFATSFGLSNEDVGHLGAETAGLLLPSSSDEDTLILQGVPAIELNTLVALILAGAPAATIAGQVSRLSMHAQRMPAPELKDGHYHATGPMTGFYELLGQQVTGIAPAPEDPPETVRASLSLSLSQDVSWFEFVESSAILETDDLAALAAADPNLLIRNPGLAVPGRFRPGLVLTGKEAGSLTVEITEAMLADYPATGLAPDFIATPHAMPVFRETPVQHPLSHETRWQTPEPPVLPAFSGPAPRSGMPSFWPFPGELSRKAAAAGDLDWKLMYADPAKGPDAPETEMQNYVWASLTGLRIRTVPGRPNTYELMGADAAGTARLLSAWQYLQANPAETASLTLLYQLSEASGLPEGLTSVPLDDAQTYLVKTNLSTKTRSSSAIAATGSRDIEPDKLFAPIGSPLAFLRLLWEAGTVGGGGYWLEITDTTGAGLPSQIFGNEGGAEISLLLTLASQTAAEPSRRIHPFNTCALLRDPVDPAATALFVEAANRAELQRRATVAPGEVGFEFTLNAAPTKDPETPETRLSDLYNLAGYQLIETTTFEGSNQGASIGPRTPDNAEGTGAGNDDEWHIQQVVPIRNFAKTESLPAVPGLPLPGNDPYAGISSGTSPATRPTTQVALWFHDVYGNTTASTQAQTPSLEDRP